MCFYFLITWFMEQKKEKSENKRILEGPVLRWNLIQFIELIFSLIIWTPVIKWSIKTVYCNIGIWSLNAAICFKNGEIQNAKLKTVNYNISVLSQPTSCTNHSLRNWTELNFLKLHSVWEFHRFLTEGKSAFFFFFSSWQLKGI